MTPDFGAIQLMAEIAWGALQVDADGVCPFCATGGFARSMPLPGRRVVCQVRVCHTCGTVLRHGDVPDLTQPPHPRVVN